MTISRVRMANPSDVSQRDRNPARPVCVSRHVGQAVVLLLVLAAPLALADDGSRNGYRNGYRLDERGYLGPAQVWPAWSAVLAQHAAELEGIRACAADETVCPKHLRGVGTLLRRARALTEDQKLRLVNRYVNRRHYRRDRSKAIAEAVATDRLRNHWSTLDDFIRNGGDCEDYATSKYFLLRELGIPAERLRVLIVYQRREREHHAVVAMRLDTDDPKDVWLLEIDNSIRRNRHHGYRYVYAVNEQGI